MPVRYVDELPPTADLVVVGGGIVGGATAFHASRAGLRVVLLERRPALCSLTTAAAAGGYRLQLDDPDEVEVVRESVELLQGFADATGQRDYDPALRPVGYLWCTTSEMVAERQRRQVERQRAWGLTDVELLDGDETRRRWPYLSPDVIQARFRQNDGLLDQKAITFGLVAGSGAEVMVRCGVTGLTVREDRLVSVETERGTVSTERCVIAGGPLSGMLASAAGVDLPIETVLRHKVVLPDVPEVPPDAPMTIDDDTAAHWRPAFGGAFALFTDPETPPAPPREDVSPEPGYAFRVLDPSSATSVARVTPFWRGAWERGSLHWMVQAGQYTMTPDHRPLIGATRVEGVFVNTGYSGHGVMAGPAGSRILTDVITGKLADRDNPFRPDRPFAGPDREAPF